MRHDTMIEVRNPVTRHDANHSSAEFGPEEMLIRRPSADDGRISHLFGHEFTTCADGDRRRTADNTDAPNRPPQTSGSSVAANAGVSATRSFGSSVCRPTNRSLARGTVFFDSSDRRTRASRSVSCWSRCRNRWRTSRFRSAATPSGRHWRTSRYCRRCRSARCHRSACHSPAAAAAPSKLGTVTM